MVCDLLSRTARAEDLCEEAGAALIGYRGAQTLVRELNQRAGELRRSLDDAVARLAELESGRGARLASVAVAKLYEFWLELPGYSGTVHGAMARVTQHGGVQQVANVKGATKGGLGGAAVGGLLLGPVGAVVGAIVTRKTTVSTDVHQADSRQFEIEVVGPGFAWSCVQGSGAGEALRKFRDLLNARSTNNEDLSALLRAQEISVQARRVHVDEAEQASQAAVLRLPALKAAYDKAVRAHAAARLSPMDEIRVRWSRGGIPGVLGAAAGYLGVLTLCATIAATVLALSSTPELVYGIGAALIGLAFVWASDRPRGARKLIGLNRSVVVGACAALIVGGGWGAALGFGYQRVEQAKAQTLLLEEQRAQHEAERQLSFARARETGLRAGAGNAAVQINEFVTAIVASLEAEQWDDANEALNKLNQRVAAYKDMEGLPPAMTAALIKADQTSKPAGVILNAHNVVVAATAMIKAGRAYQANGDVVAAHRTFVRAVQSLERIPVEYRSYANSKATLDKATKLERRVRSKADAVLTKVAREAEKPRQAAARSSGNLEAILQERCGRSTDGNGEWIAAGARERADCRRDAQLAMER